jgi:D-glycero-alpha-D-manno-heptose 1-phosphate guanylyltransferase
MHEAIILCGGKGSRISSVVSDRQKCVADIEGVPFLVHILRHLKAYGVGRAVLCAGHKAETVSDCLSREDLGMEIVISQELEPLGTGGAILQGAGHTSSDNVLALNGDSLCPLDIDAFESFHAARGADLTVALAKADGRDDAGNVEMAPDCRIVSFGEKSGARTPYLNAGVYCIRREAFSRFPKSRRFSFETDVMRNVDALNVLGYPTDAPLFDIGTPERYAKAGEFLRNLNRRSQR